MKVEPKRNIFISMDGLEKACDFRAGLVEYPCYHCGRTNRFCESSVTSYQKEEMDMMLKELNDAVEQVHRAAELIYGEDPRIIRFTREMELLKKKSFVPTFKISCGSGG